MEERRGDFYNSIQVLSILFIYFRNPKIGMREQIPEWIPIDERLLHMASQVYQFHSKQTFWQLELQELQLNL